MTYLGLQLHFSAEAEEWLNAKSHRRRQFYKLLKLQLRAALAEKGPPPKDVELYVQLVKHPLSGEFGLHTNLRPIAS